MTEEEKIRIAKRCIQKGWSFEQLKYGDDMYGNENETDSVWEYVAECQEIGTIAFNQKYP